jgi:hypothetical protein
MGKSSKNISDSDSNISDDLSPVGLSLRVVDKLLCKVFRENKKINLELECAFSENVSLRFVHNDMNAKPCYNYTMIMVNYADLWLIYSCCRFA